jgi:hypothetical protein
VLQQLINLLVHHQIEPLTVQDLVSRYVCPVSALPVCVRVWVGVGVSRASVSNRLCQVGCVSSRWCVKSVVCQIGGVLPCRFQVVCTCRAVCRAASHVCGALTFSHTFLPPHSPSGTHAIEHCQNCSPLPDGWTSRRRKVLFSLPSPLPTRLSPHLFHTPLPTPVPHASPYTYSTRLSSSRSVQACHA